ncbi:hypothetical protein [Cryptosporangium phraense]|uniref:hypothetical protein n=1 Tax=Cryptosporangium phraense TaxID=2593070 RepID=UPI00147943E7|nr:hypothetical protein [Cryptosporangium phraense]
MARLHWSVRRAADRFQASPTAAARWADRDRQATTAIDNRSRLSYTEILAN